MPEMFMIVIVKRWRIVTFAWEDENAGNGDINGAENRYNISWFSQRIMVVYFAPIREVWSFVLLISISFTRHLYRFVNSGNDINIFKNDSLKR